MTFVIGLRCRSELRAKGGPGLAGLPLARSLPNGRIALGRLTRSAGRFECFDRPDGRLRPHRLEHGFQFRFAGIAEVPFEGGIVPG